MGLMLTKAKLSHDPSPMWKRNSALFPYEELLNRLVRAFNFGLDQIELVLNYDDISL